MHFLISTLERSDGPINQPFNETLGRVGQLRPIGRVGDHTVFEILDPNLSLVADRLWQALIGQQITSAALLARRPRPDRLWMTVEWWGKLVVETSLEDVTALSKERWKREYTHKDLNLTIYSPLQHPKKADESPEVGEQATKFRSRLRDQVAHTEVISRQLLCGNPTLWFGELAGETLGGWVALSCAASDDVRSANVRIGNPAAFGFELVKDQSSLASWLSKGVVDVRAIGGTGPREDVNPLEAVTVEDVPAPREWRERDWRFSLQLRVIGVQDPAVIIGPGAVFEQPTPNGSQNLAVAVGTTLHVDAGQIIDVILPAWCLNPGGSPPSGPMRPTPLRFSHYGGGTQEAVWAAVRRLREGFNP